MSAQIITDWLAAYLIAGMAHYLLMLRSAFRLRGYEGLVMRTGLTQVPLWLFVATIVSWPVSAYRKVGRGWDGFRLVPTRWTAVNVLLSEPVVFVVAGAGLMVLR